MPNINPPRYPVDYSGTQNSNKVSGEPLIFVNTQMRFYVPQQAPFFKESVVIRDNSTGVDLRSDQWKALFLNSTSTVFCPPGKSTYLVILITDPAASNDLTLTSYQTVGGPFVTGYEQVISMLNTTYADTRPVSWPNIQDVAEAFEANQHLHSIDNVGQWEHLVNAVETLKLMIALGDRSRDDDILLYVDTAIARSDSAANSLVSPTSAFGIHVNTPNAHNITKTDVQLDKVLNYAVATLSEGYAGTANNLYVTADIASAMIRNVVNGGMNAHISRTDNPHSVTKAQVLLGNLENYSVATLADLNNPQVGTPKYVTDVVAKQFLDAKVITITSNAMQSVASFNEAVSTQLAAYQATLDTANGLINTITNLISTNQQVIQLAQSGKLTADLNEQSLNAAGANINSVFTEYVSSVINKARAEGYSQGFADGKVSQ